MFGRLGASELMIIGTLVLLIFGPKKVPEIAKSVGKGLKDYQDIKKGIKDNLKL